MTVHKTARGFAHVSFPDEYSQSCSLQKSSGSVQCIWLGVDETGPQIKGPNGQFGEVVNVRMLLSQKHVWKLLPHLIRFAITGELK